VDHPLVSNDMRTYIQKNKIEELLNQGLNTVMQQLPHDPYSTLATTLIESQNKAPVVENIVACETSFGTPAQLTVSLDVYVKYQNRSFKANTYVFPYTQEDIENQEFIFDNAEAKNGLDGVCTFINNRVAEFVKGKELPLSKSSLQAISSWAARTKQKYGQESNSQKMNCSPYAVKAVLEALQASFGKIKNPEAPALTLYEHQTLRQIPGDSNPSVPKFMFTLFNGGKALGSKVKFARFYLIMQHELEDLQGGRDALQIYYKVSSAIKKAV